MERDQVWRLLEASRVAILGTVQADGSPHLVPCVFAPRGRLVYIPVDSKPKQTRSLQRLQNLTRTALATLLVHHWDEDWARLWWVRLDGRGRVAESASEIELARELLLARYNQYDEGTRLEPIIVFEVLRWRAWQAERRD
jgi:PPOX class probable F420-dependent enzyme